MAEGRRACYIRGMVPLDYRTPEGRRRRFRPIPVRMNEMKANPQAYDGEARAKLKALSLRLTGLA